MRIKRTNYSNMFTIKSSRVNSLIKSLRVKNLKYSSLTIVTPRFAAPSIVYFKEKNNNQFFININDLKFNKNNNIDKAHFCEVIQNSASIFKSSYQFKRQLMARSNTTFSYLYDPHSTFMLFAKPGSEHLVLAGSFRILKEEKIVYVQPSDVLVKGVIKVDQKGRIVKFSSTLFYYDPKRKKVKDPDHIYSQFGKHLHKLGCPEFAEVIDHPAVINGLLSHLKDENVHTLRDMEHLENSEDKKS